MFLHILTLLAFTASAFADDPKPATPKADPKSESPKPPEPKSDPEPKPKVDPKPEPIPDNGRDLRDILGVNPGPRRVDVPRIPSITLQGFVRSHGREPVALLEIKELNRVFVVRVGTEIPITVAGKLTPAGRAELTGLDPVAKAATPPPAAGNSGDQTQVLLKVVRVTRDGVMVETGLLSQTLFIR